MRKINKSITFFTAMMILFSSCALAKKATHESPNFLNFIVRSGGKYENPELQERLSKIKEERKNSEKTEENNEEFKNYDFKNDERNLLESLIAWLVIFSVCAVVIKITCGNFKIPFDYDPNFANKHISRKKTRNKKYKFQKR